MPYRTSRRHFEEIAEKALESIPSKYRRLFENLRIVVDDYPDADAVQSTGVPHDELMGLFSGQTHGERNAFFDLPSPYPDTIFLYQKNIEAFCESEEELSDEIRVTILHEVGHYLGLTEEELEEIENS